MSYSSEAAAGAVDSGAGWNRGRAIVATFNRGSEAGTPTPATVGVASGPVRYPDPDALLVRQHQNGDARAFEQLFRKYQTPIFNMVHRMVRGEDAYDLTQDVFIKALKALNGFRGDSKFSTWLYTIARHTCLNHIRHKNVANEDSLEEAQEEHPGNEPVAPINVARLSEVRELQVAVDAVLATMAPEPRMMLILRDFEQLSYDEISQVTQYSIVNVKSKIHRARRAFEKRFAPYMELLEGGIGR
jgi:RNA polymerase sigma-70 factor, ECF subfamily